jgi:uncharacterized protein DUF4329
MSVQRDRFEAELRKPSPDWSVALNNLSALAMFEMLPTLEAVPVNGLITRQQVVDQATALFSNGISRPTGPEARITWAARVMTMMRLVPPPADLPTDQKQDAIDYLAAKLKPSTSDAGKRKFSSADAAGKAAVREINPFSIAIAKEFSGTVFRSGSWFAFTSPIGGEPTSSTPFVPIPAGTERTAIYHTHGAGISNSTAAESFSLEDREICKKASKDSGRLIFNYLGTPSGKIRKFIPNPNQAGLGNGRVEDLN